MKRSTKQIVIAVLIFDAIISFFVVIYFMQKETPLEKAYRVCEPCGRDQAATDMLIENYYGSGMTPAEAIQLWKQTAEPEVVELCRPCVEAVIDAAGYYTKD